MMFQPTEPPGQDPQSLNKNTGVSEGQSSCLKDKPRAAEAKAAGGLGCREQTQGCSLEMAFISAAQVECATCL